MDDYKEAAPSCNVTSAEAGATRDTLYVQTSYQILLPVCQCFRKILVNQTTIILLLKDQADLVTSCSITLVSRGSTRITGTMKTDRGSHDQSKDCNNVSPDR